MRVCVVAVGSTGDVLPYLGVGKALADVGIAVTVATHGSYEALVTGLGLSFHRLPMEPESELDEEKAAAMRLGAAAAAKAVAAVFQPWVRHLAYAIDAATRHADLTLLSAMAWPGIHSAIGHGIPCMSLHLQPLEPTREFPPTAFGARSLPRLLNQLLSRQAQKMMVKPYMDVVNEIRSGHSLAPMSAAGHTHMLRNTNHPILHGYSPRIVPRPADWRDGLDVVGYWWPPNPRAWQPSEELKAFVDDGPKPVYIGFGSTSPAEAGRLSQLVREAVSLAGVRAVVSSGWADLQVDHEDVIVVDKVPHEWLLPRTQAAVHHAGAGTTAAALRAGVPSVPIPIGLDQPFWASRVHRLGAATAPIPARDLDGERLAGALVTATTDDTLRRRASDLGEQLHAEDGVGAVVDAVERQTR